MRKWGGGGTATRAPIQPNKTTAIDRSHLEMLSANRIQSLFKITVAKITEYLSLQIL